MMNAHTTLRALVACALLGCSSTVNVANEPAVTQPIASPPADASVDATPDTAVTAPADPITLVVTRSQGCCGGPSSSATVFEDGRVLVRTCTTESQCSEVRSRLPGAAADVAALRRAVEATRVIEIEDGAYPPVASPRGMSLTYHLASGVRAWSTDNVTEAPRALNVALTTVYAALATSVPE